MDAHCHPSTGKVSTIGSHSCGLKHGCRLEGLDNPLVPLLLPSTLSSALSHCRRQLNVIVTICIGISIQCLCPLHFNNNGCLLTPVVLHQQQAHTPKHCCPPSLIAPPPLATSLLSSGWLLCCLLSHHCLPSAGASAPPPLVSAGASASCPPVPLPLVVQFPLSAPLLFSGWLLVVARHCCLPPWPPPPPGQQHDNRGDEEGLLLSLLLLVHHHHQLPTPAISSARPWLPPLKSPVAYVTLVVVHPQLAPFI